MDKKRNHPKCNTSLLLHEVMHHEVFTVLSINVDRQAQDRLALRGIEPGLKVEVLYNNHVGTVALRSRKGLVILGRHEAYKIRLLPQAKPIEEPPPIILPDLLYLTSLEG